MNLINQKKKSFKEQVGEYEEWLDLLFKHVNRIVAWGLFMLGVIAFGMFAEKTAPYWPDLARYAAALLALLFGFIALSLICIVGGVEVAKQIQSKYSWSLMSWVIGMIFGLSLFALGSGELVFAMEQLRVFAK